MIPVLFAPNTREYNNNGIGVLVDVGYCTVTEERNGAFELELQYPVNGSHYSDLCVDCQILAKPNETSNPQAFRIYNISKPMNGVVTVSAEHISYELSSIIVKPFSASNVVEALSKIKSNSIGENPFEFWTDKSTTANMSQSIPLSARSLLGGVSGSVLDTYTGEYEFDNYTVKLHQNRGADNGVVISYAKNLTGVKCEERSDGIVTGAVAYWSQENEGVAQVVYGDLQSIDTALSYSRNVVVDCSSEFSETPSKEQLNDFARTYIEKHKNVPHFSVSVEFINLGDTEEYKEYKGLYRVGLCDTVTVKHPLYGINVKAKVVKTVFDSITEKYEKIEIGESTANISETIAAQEKEISQKVGFSELDRAVAGATSAIAGNKGGYVVLYPNAVTPQELLILDKPTIGDASNVWRWNLSGLGHSSNGYNGEFSTAITADGQFVADFITTGTLDAANITVKNLNASSIVAGVLSSKNGNAHFSLDSGELQVGGNWLYTRVSEGNIEQHYLAGGGLIGGYTAAQLQGGDSLSSVIYYNESAADNVDISYRDSSGILNTIASFSNGATTIRGSLGVIGRYKLGDYGCISINDQGYMVFGTSAGKVSLWGQELLVTTSTSKIRISAPAAPIELYSNKDLNLQSDKYICIGTPYLEAEGFKVIVGGSMYIDGGGYFVNGVSAASITNRSDRKIKKNIKETATKKALSAVNALKIYDYDLKDSGESVKMGLMADEAPQEILSFDGEGINLYSYCGMLALAIKELSSKVDRMQRGERVDGKQNQE